jgi:membrane associated rhomboid family serine protease
MSETTTPPACYLHPGRPTNIKCQRCERPICPKCMTEAAVGFQCPECIKEGAKSVRRVQLRYGGERSPDPSVTTKWLVGINVVVFIFLLAVGRSSSEWFWRLALVGRDNFQVINNGNQGTVGITVPGALDGAWWQLVTSAFVHLDWWHIGFNMFALWTLGPQLENVLGRVRFLAVYFLSAISGSVAALLLSGPNTVTIGASGAIFGVMGSMLILLIKESRPVQQIGIWLAINLAITFLSPRELSWQGHLGGLVGGMLVTALIAYAPRQPSRTRVQTAGLVSYLVLLLAVLWLVA